MASDTLQKFLFDKTDIRGALVTLDASFSALVEGKGYSVAQQSLMGQFAAANILMTGNLKFDGALVLQARGTGPVSLVMTECNERLQFRGVIEAEHDLVGIPFADVFSAATLAITVEPLQGQRYQGIVPLEDASLALCLEHYFKQSEQLPTWFRFAQVNGVVKGMMLQALPAQRCTDAEQRTEDWTRLCHLASTLSVQEMTELDNESLLHRLYHEEQLRLFAAAEASYFCSCSRERMERALLSISEEQLKNVLAEDETVRINCHFCQTDYSFDEADVLALLKGKACH